MKLINPKIFFYSLISIFTLYLLFGILLTLNFTLILINPINFTMSQALFLLVGILFILKSIKSIIKLLKSKNNFNKLLKDYLKNNKKILIVTLLISTILLFLFYSSLFQNFNFIINVILYLPIFVLENLTFIVGILLKKFNLFQLSHLINLIVTQKNTYEK